MAISGRTLFFYVDPLSDDKILPLFKSKAFSDDNFIVAQIVKFLFDWVENIVEEGGNARQQHFLLFPRCFQKAFS